MNLDIIKSVTGHTLADHLHDARLVILDSITGPMVEQDSDALVWLCCDLGLAIDGVRAAWWNHRETGASFGLALAEACEEIRWQYN